MPDVIWTRPALEDLNRHFVFLKPKNPQAARKAALLIQEAGNELGKIPHLGFAMDDNTGRREYIKPFGAGAYILRYMLDGDTPVILRVWHSREKR